MADEEAVWGGRLWAAADLITPMAVRVAATLRVADLIADGVTSGPGLAERLGVAADPLVRVLDHLVTAGFVRSDDEGGYALTSDGEWLRSDHPARIRDWIDLEGAIGRADTSVVELLHTVRTGQSAFSHRFGRPYWQDLAADADRAASFDALMGQQGGGEAPVIAAAHDWGALGDVVDVGGGDASLLIALLRAHPDLRGTVLDLAAPAATAHTALVEAGLADRGDAITGSFFDPLPAGRGGYLLSRVIHDWNDDDAVRILRACGDAARPDGRVLVIETIDADGAPSTEMDLRMLAYVNGRERDLPALLALGRDAGLAPGTVIPAGRRTIIEFRPVTADDA